MGDRVAESGGFDPCLLLNDQIGVLIEEKKGQVAALEHMRSERLKVFGPQQETFGSKCCVRHR